jgi:4-hydroxy-tetrahydrodipicolinate synthase
MFSRFQGFAPALITPFTQDGRVDFPAFRLLCRRQIDAGAAALVVLGTTGEPAALLPRERAELITACIRESAGRVPVIAGTGSNDTRTACAHAREAAALGADAQLCVTPYYNKTSPRGLLAHFTAIADAAALPMILYNVPGRTGVNMTPETAAALCSHPMIVGVKEASGDAAQLMELARTLPPCAALYSGNDDLAFLTLALGGSGTISVYANALPAPMRALHDAYFAGDIPRARALQLSMLPLIRALFHQPSPIPVKALMARMGLCENALRLPLTSIAEEEMAEFVPAES